MPSPKVLRAIGFLCIAGWLVLMIGDWTNTFDVEAQFGIGRPLVTLPLLIVSMFTFWLANKSRPSDE